MTASGLYGDLRACAGIVGHVDLRIGAAAEDVLRSHIAAGHGRFRGIRHSASYDADPGVLGPLAGRSTAGLYLDAKFRDGFKVLHKLGLSFDAWLLEPQLPDLIDLAHSFPDTTIVLDHVGTPLGIGTYKGKREERFGIWRDNIKTLSKCANVYVKAGGLPMPFAGWKMRMAEADPPSETLGQAVEALSRNGDRGVRRRPLHVREQLPGRPLRLRLCLAVERVQARRRELFAERKDRALQRHREEGVSGES